MPFYFIIYAKTDCEYCLETINMLNENGFDYVLALLDRSPDYHNKIKKRYDWPTVPVVIKADKTTPEWCGGEELIGGCDDFKKWLIKFVGEE